MSQNTHVRVGQPGDNGNRTLYDDGTVRVIGRWLIVDGARYEIREMRHLRTISGSRTSVRTGAAIAAGAVAVIIAIASPYLGLSGWIALGLLLSVPLGLWAFAAGNGSRSSELWCEYRGHTVQALWVKGSDQRRYGQICRAITRARESLR
jgi:Family of unknown function (DUF6232)